MWVVFSLIAAAHASSQVSVESLSVDGVEVRQLSCTLDQGGLFMGSLSVVSAIATSKTALDACQPEGAAFRVDWTWAGGKTAAVAVTQASASSKATCVEKALGEVIPNLSGVCSAVLLVGEPTTAQAAVDQMKPVPGAH